MDKNVIKYIGFYDHQRYVDENRNFVLSATNKMNYIAKSIVKCGYNVDIISPSWSENQKGLYKKRRELLMENIYLQVGSTFGTKNFIMRKIKVIWSLMWLFFYLCFYVDKEEEIIVYHSMMLIYPVMLAKRIKGFKMILEVEEIYQDVSVFSKNMNKMEYNMFNIADKYIFSTELLNGKINIKNKPYEVIYGSYDIENINYNEKFNDNKIHIVYAGIIDKVKGGAFVASKLAAYLSEKFYIHIIGFGNMEDINELERYIYEINKKSDCRISYDGILKGTDYIKFLRKCDIGLSTQIPEKKYINTSFPSKILSYLSNNLRVISMRIPCVEKSKIGKLLYYYDKQDPIFISNIIENLKVEDSYNSMQEIKKLDIEFCLKIKKLLES